MHTDMICTRFLFHYISEDGITYMCMANESFGRRIPFLFLRDIQTKFLDIYTYEQIKDAPAYGMNSFSNVIETQMVYFSSDPSLDKFKQVKGDIDQVKDIMTHNIERVLQRGERIDLLVDKTDGLSQQAFAFKKRSTLLKVRTFMRYIIHTNLCYIEDNVVEKYKNHGLDCVSVIYNCHVHLFVFSLVTRILSHQ